MQNQLLNVASQSPDAPPDMILESRPRMGRQTCSACYAAHRSLTSNAVSIIACDNAASAAKEKATFEKLSIDGLTFVARGFADAATSVSETLSGPAVIICPVEVVLMIPVPVLERATLLLVQDVHQQAPDALVGAMSRFANHAITSSNVVLFSSRTIQDIHVSVRYLLRRSNRRYYVLSDSDQRSGGLSSTTAVKYSTLLCHDAEDRFELTYRALEMPGVRHSLVMVHNKEINEMRTSLHSRLGGRVYYIQRGTTSADRERTLSDFLESRSAILVAADGFTGIDLLDVDMVIMCYAPQKSMRDDEWFAFLSFLQATGHPSRPTRVVTITAPDELTVTQYFFKRLQLEMPILNVSPTHPEFHELLRRPQLAVVAALAASISPGSDEDGGEAGRKQRRWHNRQ